MFQNNPISPFFIPPFGSAINTRSYSSWAYRYGFNGKELDKDEEGMGGGGSTYDYGFRIYNPNLGKFLSVDPLFRGYPWNSNYAFAENDVIRAIDLDGLEKKLVFYGQKGAYDDNFMKNCAIKSSTKMGVSPIAAKTGGQFLSEIEANTDATNKLSVLVFWGHSWNQGLYLENDKGFYKDHLTTGDPDASNTVEFGNSINRGDIQISDHTLLIFASCGTTRDGTGGHGSGAGVVDPVNSFATSMALEIAENYVLDPTINSKIIKVTVIGADDLSNLTQNDKAKCPDGAFHKFEYQFKIERDASGTITSTLVGFKQTDLGKEIEPGTIANTHNDTETTITP